MKVLLVSILLLVFASVHSQRPRKLAITVYYESLCPDSRRFIIKQLLPAVYLLENYLIVQLVPFGKASSIANGLRGFECQHGPAECWGNMLQGCSLQLLQERSYTEQVAYIACEMNTRIGTKGLLCAENFDIPLAPLKDCVASNTGIALQLEAERLTNIVEPRFIPTITIDGEFNQEIQDRSQVDLIRILCNMLKDVPECYRRYNY